MSFTTIVLKSGYSVAGEGDALLDTLDKTLTFTNENGYITFNWLECEYYGVSDIGPEL